MAEVFFFLAAIGAVAGAIGTVSLRNPFYAVLALVCHLLALAALFLLLRAEFVAAAQVVVYAGAVMVLYVFVVAYVGDQDRPLGGGGGGALRTVSLLFAGALFVELCIAVLGSGLAALETEGAGIRGVRGEAADTGFGTAGRDGPAVPDALPRRVRGGLAAAARRRRRRGDPRPPAQRARGPARDLGGRRAARRRRHADRRPARHDDRGRRTARAMSMEWYLVVSALIFSIGAGGVLVRRNPLVILLCLELMLNGSNLALVTFARMHGNGDGQIFALIVMVVAACEVAVGLGLIVALFRRRLPIDVDELRELQG